MGVSGQRQQLHVAYGNALIATRGYGPPGNDGGFRQSPRVRRVAKRTRPNGWRPTTACGSAASHEASWRRCGRMRRLACAMSRQNPIPLRPALRIEFARKPTGSPVSTFEARGHLEDGRSPCSGRVGTTTWPFGSDMTPAPAQWPIWRPRRGLSATSLARLRLSTPCSRAIGEFHARRHACLWKAARGDVRIDTRRLVARRAARCRTRPIGP